MARNSIHIDATPSEVFATLDDACAYPTWVVGARRVRAVDQEWPGVGARFHHAIGTAAAELHDSTKVLERQHPNRLVLEVRFRPTGVALVSLDLIVERGGSRVTMQENAIRGPASWIPSFVIDPLLSLRNAVSLSRLRSTVERRAPAGAE